MIKRCLATSLVAVLLYPSFVFAQASRAGVVTTLEGNVSARRVALPDPVPLKFKDDVFLQDTVTTGDKALARMLLGGKAVVTVRERSVVTITEIPGKSTIELESGKFALAVAREKMRPGEEILIRTPNAIAGVRGTVVVTEVNRQGAQVGGGALAVVTNFYVLRGTISAQALDINKQPTGAPLSIGTMQAYTGAGSAPPRVTQVRAGDVTGITSGLSPSGPKGGEDAGKEQAKAQAVQTAVALVGALTGTQSAAIIAPPPSTNISTLPQTPNTGVTTSLSNNKSGADCAATKGTSGCSTDAAATIAAANTSTTAPIILPKVDAAILGNLTLTNQTLKTFNGVVNSTSTSPFFQFSGAFVTQTGDNPLILVDSGADVTLAGQLAAFSNSTVSTEGKLFEIEGGALKSTSTSPLIALDPTTITVGNALIAMSGGTLTLAGPLFKDVNGTLNLEQEFLRMKNSTLVDTSAEALIQLNGTDVNGGASALSMSSSTMTLAGPLLTATGIPSGSGSGSGVSDGPLFLIDNSTLSSTGTNSLISFTSMSLDQDNNIFRLTNSSTLTLKGSLMKLTDVDVSASDVNHSAFVFDNGSTVTTTGTNDPLFSFTGTASGKSKLTAARNDFAIATNGAGAPSLTLSGPFLSASLTDVTSGDPTANTFTFLFIGDGAQVSSTSTSPFMTFTNSTVDTSGDILTLRRSTSSTPSRLTLAGPLLSATNSTFNHTSLGFGSAFSTTSHACCSGFFISQGAQLTGTGTGALIQLTGSTVTGADAQSGGGFFRVADSFTGAPSGELVASSNVTLAGPLLTATNSTVTSLFDTVSVQRSSLTSTTTSPLITLTGSTLKAGAGTDPFTGSVPFSDIFGVGSSAVAGTVGLPASATLAGPVLKATNSTITTSGSLVNAFRGATITNTTTQALFQLDNTSLTASSGSFVNTGFSVFGLGGSDGASFAKITLQGPLLTATNGSSVNTTAALVFVGAGGQLQVDGSTAALISLTGGTHALSSSSTFVRGIFDLTGRSTATATEIVDSFTDEAGTHTLSLDLGTDAAIKHGGGLLEASDATITAQKGVRIDTALLDASAPLLSLTNMNGPNKGLTTTADLVDLVQKAKITAVGPVLKLDASTLTVSNGSAFLVRGGSFLKVNGDLLQLINGSTLTLTSGNVIKATGGSVVNISGALVNFGGTGGNVINITSPTNCLSSCGSFGGVNYLATNGGTVVISGTPIKGNGTFGSINYANSLTTPAIIADGANTKITISGN